MAEHEHSGQGGMDITVQEKTFASFITFVTRAVIVILLLVIVMALANA